MLALRKTTPAFGAGLVEVDAPQPPGPGWLTVDVAAAGICGSDIHAYEWTTGYGFMAAFMPLTLGHEFAGTVRAVGADVTAFRAGDRVTCWPTLACGACSACRAGRPHDCQDRVVIGLHVDGAFAGQVAVPAANCRPIPDRLPLDVAALSEPLAVAVNAVDVAEVGEGDRVVVLGPGPIGLFIAWVALGRGANVLLVGLDDAARLATAREIGIRATADLVNEPLAEAVRRSFGAEPDRVIEATGAARSVADGLEILRSGGVLVTAGIHSGSLDLDLTRFVRSKKQIRAAHDTTARALDTAIRLLAEHADILAALITHRRPLDAAVDAFDLARSRQAVKVLLHPQPATAEAGTRR
ncbi:zinc-dependent alcohol dehydrogenase [Methylobacterium planeticum]|uniref:Alcohol dehydrogenase catalytic domain-containing protein n=1 Tax=Methylobacterium planeticum TaxID=2615211 RepID=A0A6N6MTF6_9HYPH|nr:alcohol dehydrogenase catalytic domain-containing protein [Methylobacterium planeticum]KAB1072988.1 alcohol dehydrogenase catalytic domain-containing protein [Methylobacterium planeticum]